MLDLRRMSRCSAAATVGGKEAQANLSAVIAESFVSETKQALLTDTFYNFFLENFGCVAMHACEHPAHQKLCKLIGVKELKRKVRSADKLQQLCQLCLSNNM